MPSIEKSLFVPPLFYDVLSGEFKPQSDPFARSHTLGRLAYAAFIKGKEIKEGYPEETKGGWLREYSPTWAPGVSAMVEGLTVIDPNHPHFDKITSFHMQAVVLESIHDDDLFLRLDDDTGGSNSYAMDITTDDNEVTYDLELGESLALVRQAVTDAAYTFFDAANSARQQVITASSN